MTGTPMRQALIAALARPAPCDHRFHGDPFLAVTQGTAHRFRRAGLCRPDSPRPHASRSRIGKTRRSAVTLCAYGGKANRNGASHSRAPRSCRRCSVHSLRFSQAITLVRAQLPHRPSQEPSDLWRYHSLRVDTRLARRMQQVRIDGRSDLPQCFSILNAKDSVERDVARRCGTG